MGTSLLSSLSGAAGGSFLDSESEYAPFDWLSEDAHILPEAFLAKFNTSMLQPKASMNGFSAASLKASIGASINGGNNNTRQAQAASTRVAQAQLHARSQAGENHLSLLPELDWSSSDDVDMSLVDDPWTDPYQHYVMLQMEVGRTPTPRQLSNLKTALH